MVTRRTFLYLTGLGVAATLTHCTLPTPSVTAQIRGQVLTPAGTPVANARVTLFTPDLIYFQETRTDAMGHYTLTTVPDGAYQPGACALGREYRENTLSVNGVATTANFALDVDQHPGEWHVIGNTEPETFGGTNSGSLLSDGRIFYCHDATDPILFNPLTGETTTAPSSSSEQGCHMPTQLQDGRLLIVGGGTVDEAGNFSASESAVKTVRAFDPTTTTWEDWPDLNEPR